MKRLFIAILMLIISIPIIYGLSSPQKYDIRNISDEKIEKFRPINGFWWIVRRADFRNTNYANIFIPRKPKVIQNISCEALLGGSLGYPLIMAGNLIIASSERVSSFDLFIGDEVWYSNEALVGRRRVFRQLVWSKNIYEEFGVKIASYSLIHRLLIATEGSYIDGVKMPPLLISMNPFTGDVEWSVELRGQASKVTSDIIFCLGGAVVGTDSTDPKVYCIDKEGKLVWATELNDIGDIVGLALGPKYIYVTGSMGNKLYALNQTDGVVAWAYIHDSGVGTPAYLNGKIYFIDANGHLVVLDADTGALLMDLDIEAVLGDNSESFVALDSKENIYVVSRQNGSSLLKISGEGQIIAKFEADSSDELLGIPLVSRDMLVIPAVADNYIKIYFLWQNLDKLHVIRIDTRNPIFPSISVSDGFIYVVYSLDDTRQYLLVLGDNEPPIVEVEYPPDTIYGEDTVTLNASAFDEGSAIYTVILVYQIEETWIYYVGMEVADKHLNEPPIGHGLQQEKYFASIPIKASGVTVKYRILAIDNIGNYYLSKVYSFKFIKKVEPGPNINLGHILLSAGLILLVPLVLVIYYTFRRKR